MPDTLVGPLFTAAVSAVLAAVGVYVAVSKQLAVLETKVDKLSSDMAQHDLAALETKIDSLRGDVEKHNRVIERTYKLESDVATAFHRIDELRDDLHELK